MHVPKIRTGDMKSKNIRGVAAALILLSACNKSTDPPAIPSDVSLEEAYRLNSQELLQRYLTGWQLRVRSVAEEEYRLFVDTVRAVYDIYAAFYDPLHMGKYCTTGRCPEFGNDIYAGIEYAVVQNNIKYTTSEYENHKEISDFRPAVDPGPSVLFLTPEYWEALNSFLDRDVHQGDLQERYNFLTEKLSIWPGHWFGWHFLTHPEIDYLKINSTLDSAVVHFRIIFEGGEAILVHDGTRWRMTESRLTWIE